MSSFKVIYVNSISEAGNIQVIEDTVFHCYARDIIADCAPNNTTDADNEKLAFLEMASKTHSKVYRTSPKTNYMWRMW